MIPFLRCFPLCLLLSLGLLTACEDDQEGVAVGSCSDGQDNDGDGTIDCEDSGCCGGIECGVCSDTDADPADDDDSSTGEDESPDDDDSSAGDDDSAP